MKKEYQKLKEKVEMLLTEGHRDGLLPCISHFTSLVSEVCIVSHPKNHDWLMFHLQERDDLLCLEVKPVMVTLLPCSRCLSFNFSVQEYSVQEVASGATDYDEDKIMRKLEERLLKGTKKEEENGENLDVLGAVSQQFESQLARLGTHTEDLPVESDNASISSKDSPTSAPCYGTLTSSSQLVHLPLTSTECQLHQ